MEIQETVGVFAFDRNGKFIEFTDLPENGPPYPARKTSEMP